MKLKFVIHDLYSAFLADRDMIVFTANPLGAKTFTSFSDAKVKADVLLKDGKLVKYHILALVDF